MTGVYGDWCTTKIFKCKLKYSTNIIFYYYSVIICVYLLTLLDMIFLVFIYQETYIVVMLLIQW